MGFRIVVMGLCVVAACAGDKSSLTGEGVPGEQCADPGITAACYSGPMGTRATGQCIDGVTTCTWDLVWSACEGQVLPSDEDCAGGVDNDCDATTDEGPDADGDGWGACEGDCCDSGSCASDPKKVNPGAFEAGGNMLDDDCDGNIDNVDASCVAGDLADPFAYARAVDICRQTTREATGIDQRWGVISATITKPNNTPIESGVIQSAIKTEFGVNTPRYGDSLVLLSTGPAADRDDPAWKPWQPGTDMQTQSGGAVPTSWLNANGGVFPSAPGCPKPGAGDVNDPVMLTLEIRVPTNASSFTISSNFMSSEYPEYVCTPFNDFFIMLLDSDWTGMPANPKDGNLAFYTAPDGSQFPIGVNLAKGTGLFRQCVNGPLGCSGSPSPSTATACVSTAELAGSGFDESENACGATGGIVGGGTGWLNTRGNVVPGEVIKLRIAIWDTSDAVYDSAALIDNFQWKIDPTTPGTGENPL